MIKTIVIGSLNTDLIIDGFKDFPKSGGYVLGNELKISAGGKSRNIAAMIASLTSGEEVSIISKTIKDPYGFWKVPVASLKKLNINTEYVKIIEDNTSKKLPTLAFIPVNKEGQNQIFVLPGISKDFKPIDIDNAQTLFNEVAKNNGTLLLTMECPLDTAVHAVKLASKLKIKIFLNPGGITPNINIDELFKANLFFIKPNEHEAEIITGIKVTDFNSAKLAAKKMSLLGAQNILITHGSNGAYLFSQEIERQFQIPKLSTSKEADETGCGDQTMAALCASIQKGKTIEEACELAIKAGTLQFNRSGVVPLMSSELFNN